MRWRRLNNAQQLIERTAEAKYMKVVLTAPLWINWVGGKELAAAAALMVRCNILQISSAAEQLMDAARELRYYQEELNLDETELQEVSERLETYRRIKQSMDLPSVMWKTGSGYAAGIGGFDGCSAQRGIGRENSHWRGSGTGRG